MCSTAPAVFITVPKYVTITPGNKSSSTSNAAASLPKIRPAPTTTGYTSSSSSTCEDSSAPKGKKRRLDHLTWEEKIQRKKLKNRVAAQTSRDRKKARMEEMESELQELSSKTHMLQNKCDSLQIINESLMEKNRKLDIEVETLRQELRELQQQQQTAATATTTCAGCESIINGSAVSNQHTDPLQQGSINLMDSQSAQVTLQQQQSLRKTNQLAALWRVVALCLLYKICSPSTCSSTATALTMKNLMPASWKNSPKACSQISQKTWREAIENARQLLPKMQAQQSGCLDQWWGPQQQAWNPANIASQKARASA